MLRLSSLVAIGLGAVGFALVFPYLFARLLMMRMEGAPPWTFLVALLPLPVLVLGLVRVALRWRAARVERGILATVLDDPAPPLTRLRQRWTVLVRGRSAWLITVAWQRLLDREHDAAARAWVALLQLEPHDASARAALAYLDCSRGHASDGTLTLLESSLEHAGRFMPNQLDDACPLAWATLAWAHALRGETRDRDVAIAEARRDLDGASGAVAILAKRALERAS